MTRHEELIARLEASSGSRVLDLEIHIAAVKDEIWPARDWYGRITNPDARMSDYVAAYRDVIDRDDQDFDIPRYSTSIDAALTLFIEPPLSIPPDAIQVCLRALRQRAHFASLKARTAQ